MFSAFRIFLPIGALGCAPLAPKPGEHYWAPACPPQAGVCSTGSLRLFQRLRRLMFCRSEAVESQVGEFLPTYQFLTKAEASTPSMNRSEPSRHTLACSPSLK